MRSPAPQLDADFVHARTPRAQIELWWDIIARRQTTIAMVRVAATLAVTLLSAVALARQPGGAENVTIMAMIALAASASSIAGFAFSAIAGAMLFHVSADTVRLVQIMITCSIANQAAMCWSMRRSIAWGALAPYLMSGLAGVAAGVWLLLHADRAVYTVMIGVFLLAWGSYMLFRKPIVVTGHSAAMDAALAFLSGICGGAAAFPGAVVAIWCGMQGWDKTRQRALVQPFILIMQVAALLMITLARRTVGGNGFDGANLLFIPASLLGTSAGMALYRQLSDLQFARVVNVALIVSGLAYVL